MKRKILLSITLLTFLLSACASIPQEESLDSESSEVGQESSESSVEPRDPEPCTIDWGIDLTQVPRNWTRPRILRIWLDTDIWDGGGEYRGQDFASRIKSTLQEMLAYYCDITNKERSTYHVKEQTYTVEKVTNTLSKTYSSEQTPYVIPSSETWVMNLSATCRASGFIFVNGACVFQSDTEIPPYEEWSDPEEYITTSPRHSLPVANWNMEGREQWVLRQRDHFLFMMSYADYVYARMALGEEADPFEQNWDPQEIPEWKYLYPGEGGYTSEEPPENSYYFDPLQGYLFEGATVYRYDAPTYEVSDDMAEEAAMAIGHDYMQEMCSKEYVADTGMDENYKIRDYRNLEANITNRMKDTPKQLSEVTDLSGDHWKYCECSVMDLFGLAPLDTMWIVKYSVSAKVQGGQYSYLAAPEDDWFQPEGGFFRRKTGIMVKDGSTYYLVFERDIVPRVEAPV